VIEARDRVPGAHLLATGPAPEVQRRGVSGVGVFPEAFARADGVEGHLGCARDALDELQEPAGHVREPEHVNGARQRLRLRFERGDRPMERHERLAVARSLGEPAVAEHREPEAPLPGFGFGVAWACAGARCVVVAKPAGPAAPRGQHVAARVRVLLEEAPHARRELHAPDIHGVGRVASAAEVRTDRRELGVRERLVVEHDAERHGLDRRGIGHPRARQRFDDAGRERGEARELEVRGDALLARHPETQVRLDVGARHHHPHRRERSVARLLRPDAHRELGEELGGAVRVDEANHRRADTLACRERPPSLGGSGRPPRGRLRASARPQLVAGDFSCKFPALAHEER
jgi:hypothetical protein